MPAAYLFGFKELQRVHIAPQWYRAAWEPYGVAIAGVKPTAGKSPLAEAILPRREDVGERLDILRFVRFALGSLAGAAFIPVALWFSLRHRIERGRHAH